MTGRKLTVAALISTESGGVMREEPVIRYDSLAAWRFHVAEDLAGWV